MGRPKLMMVYNFLKNSKRVPFRFFNNMKKLFHESLVPISTSRVVRGLNVGHRLHLIYFFNYFKTENENSFKGKNYLNFVVSPQDTPSMAIYFCI